MISNQVLQNTLEGLKEISRTEFCVIDTEGKMLASTFADFSIQQGDVQAFVESQADSQLVKGYQYFKVCDDYQLEYILVAHGDDEDTYMVGKLAAFQIQNLIVAYKERFLSLIHISPWQAVRMGVVNKTFDIFEKEIVEDVVRTRIPSEWTREDVYE